MSGCCVRISKKKYEATESLEGRILSLRSPSPNESDLCLPDGLSDGEVVGSVRPECRGVVWPLFVGRLAVLAERSRTAMDDLRLTGSLGVLLGTLALCSFGVTFTDREF